MRPPVTRYISTKEDSEDENIIYVKFTRLHHNGVWAHRYFTLKRHSFGDRSLPKILSKASRTEYRDGIFSYMFQWEDRDNLNG